ncbi:DUF4235 domain-containing protein [Actinocrinis puniceicyclus]|uniref:DUF4235 domain-containing protein n=1 Tax=Actinocrinis puniceicyclus TaxID=977794 RepID=A0A8J8BAU5_9ACTN|nr:DUF4235 domain-containing protein [Actinocrinis puniceicyclus]MBS2961446.1 DUF4235 domain-containing protein [Actinocrinis puniceicyclus]
MNLSKAAYKPLSMAIGMGGGMVAGAVFKRVWRLVDHQREAPEPTDEDRGWREVLVASALQGTIFALVRAAVDRGGAAGVRRLTGTWPA